MSELYELPNGWEWKKLDNLTEVNIGKTPKRNNKEYFTGDKVWLSIRDLKGDYVLDSNEKITDKAIEDTNMKVISKGTLLMSFKLTLGRTAFADCDLYTNEAIASLPIKDENVLDKYFLKYSIGVIDLEKEVDNAVKGKTLNKQKIKNLDIPLPTLIEQKRIVSKLDKLFEKIDKAIALHQENMDEADVFMGSVLNDVFEELEEKYGLKQIQSLFKIKSGNFLPKKNMIENGNIDVYGGNGINGRHNEFNLSGENIVIGRVGALCGNVRCINGNIWLTDNAFYVSEYLEDIDKSFLTKMLIHINLGSSANQAAQPVISYKSISEMELPLPPLQIQQKVVNYLDEISSKIEKVKLIQKDKMDSLKALKASILDKAFRGEL